MLHCLYSILALPLISKSMGRREKKGVLLSLSPFSFTIHPSEQRVYWKESLFTVCIHRSENSPPPSSSCLYPLLSPFTSSVPPPSLLPVSSFLLTSSDLMTQAFTMVREIVITTDEQAAKTNGVEKDHVNEEPIVEEAEDAIVTRLINGSKDAWNSIPSETKWFFYDFFLAMAALLILFGLTVTGRVVLEYAHHEEGPLCRFVHSIDGLLGTSFTESLCAVQLDVMERLGWHSENLSNEIKEGIASFVDQISDGFSAFHTIIGSVLTYFSALISDAVSELGGNVEENITFLKEFIASGLDWISSNLSSFLTSFQEAAAPAN